MNSKQKKCLISQRKCSFTETNEKLVFVAASASVEFKKFIDTVISSLEGSGYKGYFAVREDLEKGFDAFCDKICSKIRQSAFCIILVNSPSHRILEKFPTFEDLRQYWLDFPSFNEILFPSPNVWYEYGLMIGLVKRVIPFSIRGKEKLPFDIQHLDVYFFSDQEELRGQVDYISKNIKNQEEISSLREDISFSARFNSFPIPSNSLFYPESSIAFKFTIGSAQGDEDLFPIDNPDSIRFVRFNPVIGDVVRSYLDHIYFNSIYDDKSKRPKKTRIDDYFVREVRLYTEGRLCAWGEIQHCDSAEFNLSYFGICFLEQLLFLIRLYNYISWEGQINIELVIQNIGRRRLQLQTVDSFSLLTNQYMLQPNQNNIQFLIPGNFEGLKDGFLNSNNDVLKLAISIFQKIVLSFGFNPHEPPNLFQKYFNGLLAIAHRHDRLASVDSLTMPFVKLEFYPSDLPSWAR